MLSGKDRSKADSLDHCSVGSDPIGETEYKSKTDFFGRAKTAGQQLVERAFLQPRRELAKRAGGAVVSGMLLMTVLFHPWAGASSAQAAAANTPVNNTPAAVATVDQNQVQAQPVSFTTAPAAQDHSGPTPDISTPDKFIAAVAPAAQDSQRETHVPASVTIAQAILESEWGRSGLSKQAQNYFGIKAQSGPGPAGVINLPTWEVINGRNVTIDDAFKAYNNLYESVMDHGRFLADNPRYSAAFQTTDPTQFAEKMHEAGYATDPGYAGKVASLISTYHLAQYDVK